MSSFWRWSVGIGTKLVPWKTNIKIVFDREVDNVFLAEVNGLQALLHLEYQNYADPTMALRVFQYIAALKLQYYQQHQQDIPVVTIVIWATASTPPAPIYESTAAPGNDVVCHYSNLWLNDLDWQQIDPVLLVLGPFLRGVTLANAKTVAVQMYQAAPPEHRRVLLNALLILLRRKYHNTDEIEQDILQQVRESMDVIQDAIANDPFVLNLVQKGKVQGIAEGEAKGIAEGKVEGEATAITLLWQARFGSMPEEVAAALRGAREDHIQRILLAFAKGPTEDEVRAILGV